MPTMRGVKDPVAELDPAVRGKSMLKLLLMDEFVVAGKAAAISLEFTVC